MRGSSARRRINIGDGGSETVSGGAQILALVIANVRFWGSVAPVARGELALWRKLAGEIGDRELRGLALAKLTEEAFNAEVAATLATLAPGPQRTAVVKAIVALEVLFDYLDGRTEALFDSPAAERAKDEDDGEELLAEGRLLSKSLSAAVSGEGPTLEGPDRDYVGALWRHAHEHIASLPGLPAVTPAALAAASRCAEAQLRLHAAPVLGDEQLQSWAEEACKGSGLGWREYLAGGASSVLAMHALIATAVRADVTGAEAHALGESYLTIGAVITTLDSLVDDHSDRGAGETGYIRLYDGRGEIEPRLVMLIRDALERAGRLPDGAHHAMTLAGVAAYYSTHPGATDAQNRPIVAVVRSHLAPVIWPALAVIASWRAAKRGAQSLDGWSARAHGRVGSYRRSAPRRGVR